MATQATVIKVAKIPITVVKARANPRHPPLLLLLLQTMRRTIIRMMMLIATVVSVKNSQ